MLKEARYTTLFVNSRITRMGVTCTRYKIKTSDVHNAVNKFWDKNHIKKYVKTKYFKPFSSKIRFFIINTPLWSRFQSTPVEFHFVIVFSWSVTAAWIFEISNFWPFAIRLIAISISETRNQGKISQIR